MTRPAPTSGPILEIRRIGNALRVSALDPISLDEIVLQAPLGTPLTTLRRICTQKLQLRQKLTQRI